MAFTNAILGATHAMSHQIGGELDAPHGVLLAERVRELADKVGMPKGLAALGVTEAALPHMARTTLRDACMTTNPREADARDIEALFRAAL